MRATILGDIMKNYGIPDDTITIAQQGFLAGDITGLTVFGLGGDGYIRHHAPLTFAELTKSDDVTVDLANGRSMTEAVSVKLAQGVSYSVATMKRLGLTIAFTYFFAPGKGAETMAKFGLVPGGTPYTYAPGTAGRQLFAITPGLDKGITFAHFAARSIR
jgi:hypothetical protein